MGKPVRDMSMLDLRLHHASVPEFGFLFLRF